MIVFTDDKDRLLRHFQKDPVLFAYHIGDLDDFHFPHCQWASIYEDRPHIVDCVLIYTGLEVPTVLAFGLTERMNELMTELVDLLPKEFYCHYDLSLLPVLAERYEYTLFGPHDRMTVKKFTPTGAKLDSGAEVVRLNRSHEEELRELYALAYPGSYFMPRMLETGMYRAIRIDGRFVGAAGVHVDSAKYKTAVLGNIATLPEYRGKGLASVLTSELTGELVTAGKQVSLNVKADNTPAVRCYERLGFVAVHQHEEGFFTRR